MLQFPSTAAMQKGVSMPQETTTDDWQHRKHNYLQNTTRFLLGTNQPWENIVGLGGRTDEIKPAKPARGSLISKPTVCKDCAALLEVIFQDQSNRSNKGWSKATPDVPFTPRIIDLFKVSSTSATAVSFESSFVFHKKRRLFFRGGDASRRSL